MFLSLLVLSLFVSDTTLASHTIDVMSSSTVFFSFISKLRLVLKIPPLYVCRMRQY
jgi:hypothetical protein